MQKEEFLQLLHTPLSKPLAYSLPSFAFCGYERNNAELDAFCFGKLKVYCNKLIQKLQVIEALQSIGCWVLSSGAIDAYSDPICAIDALSDPIRAMGAWSDSPLAVDL